MDLTDLSRLRKWWGEKNFSNDWATWFENAIKGGSKRVEILLDRWVLTVERTIYVDVPPKMTMLYLKGFPVTSIASVHNDPDRVFGSTSEITSDDYALALDTGKLDFDWELSEGPQALKIVYTGGMAANTRAFITAFSDISEGLDEQLAHEFQRKHDAGMVRIEAGELTGHQTKFVTPTWAEKHGDLLPKLMDAIRHNRSMVRRS